MIRLALALTLALVGAAQAHPAPTWINKNPLSVCCHVEVPHVSHEIGRIEAFVGAHREALGARRITHDHVLRGLALGHAGRLSQFCFDDEAIAVLGHDVARISELCLLALAFFGKLASGSVVEACVSLLRCSP